MKFKQYILAAAMVVTAVVPMQSQAAVAVAKMTVSATVVVPTGTVSVSGPMDFGTLLANTTGALATTTVTVNVTKSVPYTIGMDHGLTYNSAAAKRMMNDLTVPYKKLIQYELYTDAARTAPWPWSLGGTPGVKGWGTGLAQTVNVYGKSFSALVAGTFTDTVTVTLTY